MKIVDPVEQFDGAQEDYAIFTEDVYDIIPEVDGEDAVVEILMPFVSEERARKSVKDFAKLGPNYDSLAKSNKFKGSMAGSILSDMAELYTNLMDEISSNCEDRLEDIRQWATGCLAKMKLATHTPEMTGNLIDSVRIMGNDYNDIDIDVWADKIAEVGRNPKGKNWLWNKHKYYDGRAPGTVKVTLAPYDYSIYADGTALNGLKHFRSVKWEVDIKAPLARTYGLEYQIKHSSKG